MRVARLALAVARQQARRLRAAPADVARYGRESRPWRAAERALREHAVVDPEVLRAGRRSDLVFVFGSGGSLAELSADAWAGISVHDTFGFNWFVRQEYVRCDFHLVRGVADATLDRRRVRSDIEEYFRFLRESPWFADSTVLLQHERRAFAANTALLEGMIPPGRPILPWHTFPGAVPSDDLARGLAHGSSTLFDSINAAYLLGWSEIVLAGVDLYDRQYFWLERGTARGLDAERGAQATDPHSQVGHGVARQIGTWSTWLARRGVRLSVLNPRSLLADVLPVHTVGSTVSQG
jgi:hypothetical protein